MIFALRLKRCDGSFCNRPTLSRKLALRLLMDANAVPTRVRYPSYRLYGYCWS